MTRSGWNPIPLAGRGGAVGIGLRGCQRHRVRNASAMAICLLGSSCSCRRGPFHGASQVSRGRQPRGTSFGIVLNIIQRSRYNNQSLVWGQAVQLKPGSDSVTLDQRDATPVN